MKPICQNIVKKDSLVQLLSTMYHCDTVAQNFHIQLSIALQKKSVDIKQP
jgi:hypothetical protein